ARADQGALRPDEPPRPGADAAGRHPRRRRGGRGLMRLGVDDDELATCVSCGLCLPHCPTYRVTGEEALSPRGRVAAMRQVQWEGRPADPSFVRSLTTCVQCRGCETACPSGVPFGHLIEPARAALATGPAPPPWPLRVGLRLLPRHRPLLAGSSLPAIGPRPRRGRKSRV